MDTSKSLSLPASRSRSRRLRSIAGIVAGALVWLAGIALCKLGYIVRVDSLNFATFVGISVTLTAYACWDFWPSLFPKVLTLRQDGLQITSGAWPLRRRQFIRWEDAVILRFDHSLQVFCKNRRFRPLIALESQLDDRARDHLIDRLKNHCEANQATFATEDARITSIAAGGRDLGKYWKG